MTMAFAPDVTGQAAQPIAIGGGLWFLTGTLTLSGSYAALGDVVDLTKYAPAGATMRKIYFLTPIRSVNATYDLVNKKVRLWTLNPAGATSDVAPVELAAAAYDADLAVAHDVILAIKA